MKLISINTCSSSYFIFHCVINYYRLDRLLTFIEREFRNIIFQLLIVK